MENFEDIHYLNCPHFTVGRSDQWGEQGYLLYGDKVYSYEEDRKEQCGRTHSPTTVKDFLIYSETHQIPVPDDFRRMLVETSK